MKQRVIYFIAAIMVVLLYGPTPNVSAKLHLESWNETKYAENNILFYDECGDSDGGSSGSSSGGSSGGSSGSTLSPITATGDFTGVRNARNANKQDSDYVYWEPNTHPKIPIFDDLNKDTMRNALEEYGDLAYELGKAVGAPWVAIIVQMRYEDPTAYCGKNNFWGNGCWDGHKGHYLATFQGSNLGEGFQQYGQTLTNGNFDGAIGIADPKEYLRAIGPMWVHGKSDGPGYGEINAMEQSVDALQAYIETPEGREIVETFGHGEGGSNTGSSSGSSGSGSSSSSGSSSGSSSSSSSNPCTPYSNSSSGSGSSSGTTISGDAIVETALKYTWPYWGESDGGEEGTCDTGSGIVEYDKKYTDSICRNNPKPAYRQDAISSVDNYRACNVFVETVVIKSGADPDYRIGTADVQLSYLTEESNKADGKWELVTGDLKPGDVGVNSGHAAIYVGEAGGEYGVMAQASLSKTVPVVAKTSANMGLTYFRLKSRSNTSTSTISSNGKCNPNSPQADGCTIYYQGDAPWGDEQWGAGKSTYRDGGCGPSSLAMIISNLTNKTVLPNQIDPTGSYHVVGAGSDHSIVRVAEKYGLNVRRIGWNKTEIESVLKSGGMIHICSNGSMQSGLFGNGGHCIGIRGINPENGNWLFFDSAKSRDYTHKELSPNDVLNVHSIKGSGNDPYAITK